MARFFLFIAGWIGFIAMAFLILHLTNPTDRAGDEQLLETINLVNQDPIFKQIQQAYQEKDYLTALQLIDEHEVRFSELPEKDYQLGFHFYHLKGHIHSSVWQHIEAEDSWQKARSYTSDKRLQARLLRLIKASRHIISDINYERNLRSDYQASPYVGPAAALDGKIVLIYVFITDGTLQSWSIRKREFVMNNWRFAQAWIEKNVEQYKAEVSFVHRLFVVDKNPYIKRLKVADFDDDFVNADRVAQLVAKNFNFKDIISFVNHVKQQENADQAMLLFHLARDGRSFASRCMYRCKTDAEYVFLMEKPDAKFWQAMGYAQAHESLHLFGADDLYNIQNAKYYAVRDIMNYPSSILEASTLDEITAYATGLIDQKPEAPFKIRNFTPARE
jgi:hypothetical protein